MSLDGEGGNMNTKHVAQSELATFPTSQPFLQSYFDATKQSQSFLYHGIESNGVYLAWR